MFNRRLLIDSGGKQQTYSVLEIHVDTPDGDHVRSARVELTYNGESNLANTDNKGIAVFYGVPTGTEISYTITAAGYNAATGKWIIPTDVEYETEYVTLTTPLPSQDTDLWYSGDSGYYGTVKITIPDGVKVLFVGATVEGGESGEPCHARMESTTKTWFNIGGENRISAERLIGVTPNKTYSVLIDYDSELGAMYGFAFIRYSQRINNLKPTITDY